MVHALVAHARPGDVLVLTSAEPAPVAFVGDLLATQAQAQGVAGILVDGAVRDLDELAELGLPIWTRFVRAQGATKGEVGKLDVPVVVGGVEIRPGDLVVMDCDGAVVVPTDRVDEMLPAARERAERETAVRQRYRDGDLSYDLQGLRALVEGLMEVAVLGLGEAGGRIAADLVAAGCAVRGWDPVARPAGIDTAPDASSAVRGAEVVLSINAAAVALEVAGGVAGSLADDAVYADCNTSSPALKRALATSVPACFADVALVGTVPTLGLRTPALASGAGAERFAELFRPLGMPVDVVGSAAGDAAGLKLLRSVFMKGLAAAAIESVEAARAAGAEEWVRADIASVIGEPLLERLLTGSRAHAARRVDEMHAAADYLAELGVSPRVAAAASEWLAELRDGDL